MLRKQIQARKVAFLGYGVTVAVALPDIVVPVGCQMGAPYFALRARAALSVIERARGGGSQFRLRHVNWNEPPPLPLPLKKGEGGGWRYPLKKGEGGGKVAPARSCPLPKEGVIKRLRQGVPRSKALPPSRGAKELGVASVNGAGMRKSNKNPQKNPQKNPL